MNRTEAKQAVFNEIYGERTTMRVTSETKAVLRTEGLGRIIGFVKSEEPGKISLAVPGDRAVMVPEQARELAAWLVTEADKADKVREAEREELRRARAERAAAEVKRREEIRAALGDTPGLRPGMYRRAY
ncbi:hypothetical protein HXS80_15990 [Streptomyces sp. CB04723]|uniref:hypothetical protein n=1 Tax=Streptomyces TaxID=1883 RepID=UPI0015C4DD55|nr:hypothetical protein [Streptomyces sp. CB04723]QLG33028.1 hypothetical protein HXS80_15990 [Streptomyces sp. CB04723]